MGNMNQQQKICITSIDECGQLQMEKPKDLNEIKNKNFTVIDGQHSIAA
jgi:hypothetical protein